MVGEIVRGIMKQALKKRVTRCQITMDCPKNTVQPTQHTIGTTTTTQFIRQDVLFP